MQAGAGFLDNHIVFVCLGRFLFAYLLSFCSGICILFVFVIVFCLYYWPSNTEKRFPCRQVAAAGSLWSPDNG